MGLLDLTVTQKIIKTVNICFDSAFFRRAWNMFYPPFIKWIFFKVF